MFVYTIKTFDYKCTFTIVPLIKENSKNKNRDNIFTFLSTNSFHLYDIPEIINSDINRHIRLLIFMGITDICIHTTTYENKEGWAYNLHLLFNGYYYTEYLLK